MTWTNFNNCWTANWRKSRAETRMQKEWCLLPWTTVDTAPLPFPKSSRELVWVPLLELKWLLRTRPWLGGSSKNWTKLMSGSALRRRKSSYQKSLSNKTWISRRNGLTRLERCNKFRLMSITSRNCKETKRSKSNCKKSDVMWRLLKMRSKQSSSKSSQLTNKLKPLTTKWEIW